MTRHPKGQYFQNLLREKTSEADGLRSRAQKLASSISVLEGELAAEQSAFLLTRQELSTLKAKLSKLPLRLLIR
jgi:hypothetical protein